MLGVHVQLPPKPVLGYSLLWQVSAAAHAMGLVEVSQLDRQLLQGGSGQRSAIEPEDAPARSIDGAKSSGDDRCTSLAQCPKHACHSDWFDTRRTLLTKYFAIHNMNETVYKTRRTHEENREQRFRDPTLM